MLWNGCSPSAGICVHDAPEYALTRFLEVPGVPLDNNEVEQELKPSQRHRKNSLFFKTQAGADVGDVLLSMIRTAVKKVSTRCTI